MESKVHYQELLNRLIEEHPFWNSTDLAYEIILQGILSVEWGSGERIPQEQLASMLNMSRTPIRDACARLIEEAYLERNDKNTCCVATVKLKDYIDFCEYRNCLESRAAFLAARNINDEQLEALRKNLEAFKQAEAEGDLHKAMSLDNEFHLIIAKASKNKFMYESIKSISRRKTFYLHILVQRPSFKFVVNKHTAIYEAIKNNNEEWAERMMLSHLNYYLNNIGNVSI